MNRRLLPLRALAATLAFSIAWSTHALARDFHDMRGRKVALPAHITRVFATSPPGTYVVYAIDPGVLVGLNFPLCDNEKRYTVPRLQTLPVIGGAVGMGRTINQEVLLKAKPDVIVMWDFGELAINSEYEAMFARMGIPWVYVKANSVWDWPDALAFTGTLLGQEARGRELQQAARKMLDLITTAVGALPEKPGATVYYAEGADGLSTEGSGSVHAELIDVVKARNVHHGKLLQGYGMEHISLEQVIGYDPDVILVKETAFYKVVFSDPRWKALRAVRERRVFLIPHTPFNWFDRPPSFMRLLGAQWLFSVLYPGRLPIDLKARTKAFYQAFLGVTICDAQVAELLSPP